MNQDFDSDHLLRGLGDKQAEHPVLGVTQYSAEGRELMSSWSLGWFPFLAIPGPLLCRETYLQSLSSCPVLPKYKCNVEGVVLASESGFAPRQRGKGGKGRKSTFFSPCKIRNPEILCNEKVVDLCAGEASRVWRKTSCHMFIFALLLHYPNNYSQNNRINSVGRDF